MKTKTCLVVHPYTAKKDVGAGHDRYAYELIQRLPRHDIELDVFHSGDLSSMTEAAFAELKAISRLKSRKEKCVYHATATMNAMAPITAKSTPLITTIHDVLWFFVKSRYDSGIKYKVKEFGIKRAASKSDQLIVPFRSTYEFLVDNLKVAPHRIKIVPYGVDHQQFFPKKNGENLSRPAFLEPGYKNILFVGAVNKGKGIDTLIASFAEVKKQVPDARLVIGSKGWDTPAIKALVDASPAKSSILMTGFIPEADLRAAYIYADVTAFPSRYGFGLSVLESMACGTATVSGRTLDAPEFVGNAGSMVDPDSPSELASALIKLLCDDRFRSDMVKAGLEKSAAYDWEQTAKETARVYREI
jgi:glycosyltransferase involved in cell wall biosynthesis